jgi:hypothetical protein
MLPLLVLYTAQTVFLFNAFIFSSGSEVFIFSHKKAGLFFFCIKTRVLTIGW